jgi:phosphatidylglycerol lysyltransferase
LSGEDISRVVLFYSSTYWLGLNVVGGWALAGGEIHGIDTYLPPGLARVTGWLFLASALAYPLFVLLRRTPLYVAGVRIELPSMGLVGSQFVLSMLDWVLAGAVLYVLIPAPRPEFLYFLGAFLAAQLVALISHVPGGLGVFESLMVLLLGLPAAKVLPALALFRVIYYLVPLSGALLVLLVDEVSQRRHQVVQWGNAFGTLTASVAPKLLALFVMLGSAVLLASGAAPADGPRLALVLQTLPLPVIEVAHFGASLAGVLLLLASWGMSRRLADGFRLGVAGLLTGIVLSLVKGLDYETAVVLAALLVALLLSREEFGRRAAMLDLPFSLSWTTGTLVIIASSIGLGLFAFRDLDYSHGLWWWVDRYGDMSRFLRASGGVLLVLVGLGIVRLVRRPRPATTTPSPSELVEADRLARASSTPDGSLVVLGDHALLWNPQRSACLMYGVHGHTWVALGEPLGPSSEAEGLVGRFLERCDDYEGLPVIYGASKDWLHVFTDYGLTFVTLGEDARVFLPHFSIEGSGHRAQRTTLSQLQRLGMQMRVDVPPAAASLVPSLADVSAAWLAERGATERRFAAGRFDERYVSGGFVMTASRHGAVEAFATMTSLPGRQTLEVDLVRHRPGAPRGILEGMIAWLLVWARQHGYTWCDLGMAPPARLERPELIPLWRDLLKTAPGFSDGRATMRTVREERQKFDPAWEPRYLVYPGGAPLGSVLADVQAILAGAGRR